MKIILCFLATFPVYFVSFCKASDSFQEVRTYSINDTARYFTFGGTQTEEFRDLAMTSDSGFILVGTTNGYGPGNSSIYVVKTDKRGQHKWSAILGGSNLDQGTAVVTLSDANFLFAGSSNSAGAGGYDGYIAKTDGFGAKLWERYIGGSDWDFIYDMTLLPDSNIILCGESYSFSSGGTDAWVVKLDKSGNLIWQRHFGSAGNDSFRGVSVFGNSLYLCGYYEGVNLDGYLVKLDFDGQMIFEKTYNQFGEDRFNSICISTASTILLAGGSVHTDSLKSEFWLIETDTTGLWTGKLLHGISSKDDYFNAVISKANGDIIASGLKNPDGFGQKSMFTVEVDSNFGNFRPHSFGGNLDEESFSMLETTAGEIAIAGYTSSYGSGNRDACLLLLDTNDILDSMVYLPIVTLESLSPIGISEYSNSPINISIFPNPALDYLTVSNKNPFDKLKLSLISLDGRILLEEDFNLSNTKNINISTLDSGFYILSFKNQDGQIYSEKIIKR
ncbi:MAG: T9SS type A sorting domain-containing protein [Bacteroidetes bacterium]|nr:MAG: T9SS type A sorting domain-containing protein [Bacteroidota bacterium]